MELTPAMDSLLRCADGDVIVNACPYLILMRIAAKTSGRNGVAAG
jgi:hypothetical protein